MLDVYLNQKLTGKLSVDKHGDMVFFYHEEYTNNPKNLPLSQSLPLQSCAYNAKQCRPFFSGILPEAHLRVAIARQLGISEKNDFALLTAIGGDCAGAITLLPSPSTLITQKPDYRAIDKKALINLLQSMHQRPMIAGEDGIRLSLAGAQDKLPIALIDGQIAIPINGAASTHILKPINRDFPSLIENEYFCLQLAQKIGLNVADSSLHAADEHRYLLIKRYDRIIQDNQVQRLHQEDFCQALSIIPEMKYQREGGPSLSACFKLLRQISSVPVIDLKMLLQGVLFNLIIGNNDAHGKNFSLLYKDGQIRLAPYYDLISTVFYPELSAKMAMKIGSKYDFKLLFPRHLTQMSEEIGLSNTLVKKQTLLLINKILENIADSPYSAVIVERAIKLERQLNN
jgi:serine/threonine-protein kinase HipA